MKQLPVCPKCGQPMETADYLDGPGDNFESAPICMNDDCSNLHEKE